MGAWSLDGGTGFARPAKIVEGCLAGRTLRGNLAMRKLGSGLSLLVLVVPFLVALALPALGEVIYVEQGGVVVGEGELFTSRATYSGKDWPIVALEAANGLGGPAYSVGPPANYQNARGGRFIQSLPDDNGATGGPRGATSLSAYYKMLITTTGTYRLYTRWQGHGGNSDSIFFSINELSDGAVGAIADWYEDGSNHSTANFSNDNWDGSGGMEQNTAGPSQNPMTWTIATPGIYTLRVEPREDGLGIDAFAFQLSSLSAPTGYGPKRSLLVPPAFGGQAVPMVAAADSFVRSGSFVNTNYGTATAVSVKNDTAFPSDYNRKGYVRFEGAFDLLTPEMLLDAKLELTAGSVGGNWRLNVYGLRDGVAGENWSETGITWNNAPGNNTGNGGGDPLLSANGGLTSDAVFLGQIDLTGVLAGDKLSLTDVDTAGELLKFILSDTDGRLTFILTRMERDTPGMDLVSRENPTYDPPTLTLYLAIPEPGSLLLLGGGLAAVAARRRRRR